MGLASLRDSNHTEQLDGLRESGKLVYGQVPMLEIGERRITQSMASALPGSDRLHLLLMPTSIARCID